VAHPQIAVFARMADGGANPVRKLEGQATLLGRTMHAIAYDEIHDEIFVPIPLPQAILAFRGGADGEEVPLRVIQGSQTQLTDPQRLAIDPVHNEIFVPIRTNVLVFPRNGNGNVAPLRVLEGPDGNLRSNAMAVDPVRNLIVLHSEREVAGRPHWEFVIFDRTAQGRARPLRVIGGPKSMVSDLGGPFAISPTGKIVASMNGNLGEELATSESFVGIWDIQANGDVPPEYTIGGPNGILQMVRGVTLNPKHKEIIVTDKRMNAVLTFSLPEIF
jgi:hypothetical protein